MKKLCHVTSAHDRYDTRIFQKECKTLSKSGYQVYLIVNDDISDEEIDGVKIVSTNIQPKSRFERFFKTKKKMLQIALQIDADIYHFHDPDLIGFAWKLKKRKQNIKIVFDSHEDIPAQILEKEWMPSIFRKFISNCFQKYQEVFLKHFDYLIGVTPHVVNKLKKINNKTEMITNFPVFEEESDSISENNNVPNNILCFAGGIQEQWNHQRILSVLKDVDAEYLLCGSGDESYIEKLKTYPEWSKVKYMGKISFEEVGKIYIKSSVGMAILSYSPNTNYEKGTLGNTKIFEYMQAGLPVICSDFELWKEIVEKNNCGICVNPTDVQEIKKAVIYLLQNPTIRKKMGQNGRKLVREKLNWNVESSKLATIYTNLLCEEKND